MKKIRVLGLALLLTAFCATSALALTANHAYTVQLMTVSATGQQTAVDSATANTDSNGILNFQFADVPDTTSAPFLMVQIMDTVGGQQQTVRQTLIPAPTAGENLQMGVNAVSNSQALAALAAMQSAVGTGTAALRVMFPMTMVPSGAINSSAATGIGQAAATAATTFQDYLAANEVTTPQLNSFQSEMLAAMRSYAAATEPAAKATDPGTAARIVGDAQSQFMAAMIQAAQSAGIDPALISNAFDQAGQAIDNSSAFNRLSPGAMSAVHGCYQAGAAQRQLFAQMSAYAAALPVVGASAAQTQTVAAATTTLNSAITTAQQNFFQNAFANPTTVDPTTVDSALAAMQTAMQGALNTFTSATTATTSQIDTMLTYMVSGMNGMMGGGMIGGGMMTSSGLYGMGYGMMTTYTGTTQNWSTMMVAASNLLASAPNFSYPSAAATQVTTDLTDQLTTAGGIAPATQDWIQLPEGPYKSLLELQYDLMLVHLIDMQTVANATQNWTQPLAQADLAAISSTDLANRMEIFQNVQGLTPTQSSALMAALSPVQMF